LLCIFGVVVGLILVPFFLWEEAIQETAGQFLKSGTNRLLIASFVIALLALDVVLPVPSSIVSVAVGALLGFAAGTASIWLGMTLGCALGYSLGRQAPHRWLSAKDRSWLERGWNRWGDWILIACRPIPVLAEASVLFAGFSRIYLPRFLALCAGANLGVSLVYGAVGAWSSSIDAFLPAFLAAVVIPGLGLIIARSRRL